MKDAAIKEAERAITLRLSGDAVEGPGIEENLAYVEVLVGDKNRAIPRLQRLLKIPYTDCLTPALLRLHPAWDPLRGDPAFQKLCRKSNREPCANSVAIWIIDLDGCGPCKGISRVIHG
jgi:hypothetical protein